jgi:hypothetical protein
MKQCQSEYALEQGKPVEQGIVMATGQLIHIGKIAGGSGRLGLLPQLPSFTLSLYIHCSFSAGTFSKGLHTLKTMPKPSELTRSQHFYPKVCRNQVYLFAI